jgi:hypothetical protein
MEDASYAATIAATCACGSNLCTLSQPDEEAPQRILAVCSDCGAWLLSRDGGGTFRRIVPPIGRSSVSPSAA